jgi:ankyrin repeat protein
MQHELTAAIRLGDLERVQELLRSGATPNPKVADGASTPLHDASARGQADIVHALLAAQADYTAFDAANRSPLHVSCRAGAAECVRALLSSVKPSHLRVLLTWADEVGGVPLHHAALSGSEATVAVLLEAHAAHAPAGVDAVDRQGLCALHMAAARGAAASVAALLAGGAAAGPADKQGRTPLIVAVIEGHIAAVHALLQSAPAAALDHADADGLAALHWAAVIESAAIYDALLDAGADASRADADGNLAERPRSADAADALGDAPMEEAAPADNVEQMADDFNSFNFWRIPPPMMPMAT